MSCLKTKSTSTDMSGGALANNVSLIFLEARLVTLNSASSRLDYPSNPAPPDIVKMFPVRSRTLPMGSPQTSNVYNIRDIFWRFVIKHSWSNGRIIAFQAIGPGSSKLYHSTCVRIIPLTTFPAPGGCTTSFFRLQLCYELSFFAFLAAVEESKRHCAEIFCSYENTWSLREPITRVVYTCSRRWQNSDML
jgi:hypothetical protein